MKNINIIFEGTTGSGKTTIIQLLKKYYNEKNIKVGATKDMDEKSPYYQILKKMYQNSANMTLNSDFNTSLSETFVQLADLIYSIEKIKNEKNEINLFDRYIFSVIAYQDVLIRKEYKNSEKFIKNLKKCCNCIIPKIDAIVYFKLDFRKCIRRTEKRDNRTISRKEKEIFKEFDENLEKLTFEYAKENNIPICVIDNENLEINMKKIKEFLRIMRR